MGNNYILIDGSYYIFYRYYALNIWWGHQAIPLAVGELGAMPPVELIKEETISKSTYSVGALPPPLRPQAQVQRMELPPEFIEKFKSTFVSKINDIDKKLKLKNTIKYVGKDCRRSEIWRTALYPEYKATRGTSNDFLGAPLFEMVYDEHLYEKAGIKQILSYPSLEADDCIALTAKHLYKTEPDAHIWIIASDMDYLQITNDRIHLYDLKFKNICEKSSGNPMQDLFCKIVAGDKSDNIPPVFKKCGIKTAQKYFNDRDLFEKKLATDKEAQEIYKLNTTLVDFNCIPEELVKGFTQMYLSTI
jgi:5'-3' exonuclease